MMMGVMVDNDRNRRKATKWLSADEMDLFDRVQSVLIDGWRITHVTRAGRTWTASASPFDRAFHHWCQVMGAKHPDRPMMQGQGDTASEALLDLEERFRVDIDPRLVVRRSQ